jgi:predicted MFS family arabinose efflux permease
LAYSLRDVRRLAGHGHLDRRHGQHGGRCTAAAVVGLGYGLPFPALTTPSPDGSRLRCVGAVPAFCDVFVGLGSVAGGLVAEGFATPAVLVLAAAGVVAAAVVNVALARQDRAEHPGEQA